jgi:hypothetical protein
VTSSSENDPCCPGVVIDPSTDEPFTNQNADIGRHQHMDRVEEEPVISLVGKIKVIILTS